jgi:glycosyltransferase involved in cell wall biosynthesis
MAEKKTIVVAHSRPDTVSGAELAIADIVDQSREDFEYIMLTPGQGALAGYYREKGITVWSQKVETKRRLYPGLHTLQSLFFSRRLKRRHVDAVMCNTFAAAARVKTACRMAGIPWAIYVREYISKKEMHRETLEDATMVLAVSRDVADHLSEMISSRKISVAYDHILAQPLLKKVDMHKSGGRRIVPFELHHPVIGYIGRITKYKQPDLFLRSIPAVLAQIPEARFVVVGSAGTKEREYERSLKILAHQLGIDGKVAFMGHRLDAIEIMSELSVCCLTSDREPFPRTILEAQLLGIPVVAPDTGGCPEMVSDGVSGILFSAVSEDAPEFLAAAIARILRHPALASALAVRARERLVDGVASLKPVRRLEELLCTLINGTE